MFRNVIVNDQFRELSKVWGVYGLDILKVAPVTPATVTVSETKIAGTGAMNG